MIPLAQFLTEFDEDEGTPFDVDPGQRQRPSTAGSPDKPVFEPLSLVRSAPEPFDARLPVSSPLPLIEADASFATEISPERDTANEGEPINEIGKATAPPPLAIEHVDPETALRDAVDAARAAALEEANQETAAKVDAAVAAARAEDIARFEAEKADAVAKARQKWSADEGDRLGSLIQERLDRIETIVKASLSSVLRPIALDARRKQSLGELVDAADLLIGDGSALSIRASGPADLLDALASSLGDRSRFMTMQIVENGIDLRIECEQTVVETRLNDWQAALTEALA